MTLSELANEMQYAQLRQTLGDAVVVGPSGGGSAGGGERLSLASKDFRKQVKLRYATTSDARFAIDRRMADHFATQRSAHNLAHHLAHCAADIADGALSTSATTRADIDATLALLRRCVVLDVALFASMVRVDAGLARTLWSETARALRANAAPTTASKSIVVAKTPAVATSKDADDSAMMRDAVDALGELERSGELTAARLASLMRTLALHLTSLGHARHLSVAERLLHDALTRDRFNYGGAHAVIVHDLIALCDVAERRGALNGSVVTFIHSFIHIFFYEKKNIF